MINLDDEYFVKFQKCKTLIKSHKEVESLKDIDVIKYLIDYYMYNSIFR